MRVRHGAAGDRGGRPAPAAERPESPGGTMQVPTADGRGPRRWRASVVVACLLAGVLLGTARSYSGGHEIRARSADLSALVTGAEQRVQTLEGAAATLQEQIDAAAGQDVSPQVAAARAAVGELRAPAGLTAVHGPGVRVTLTDAPRDAAGNYPAGVDPDNLVVHQQDVQAVVNALWAGGAEAMEIMDQRVVTTSAVRCIGNTLLLGGRTYSPPFVVAAIGDGTAMTAAIEAEPGVALFVQYARRYGLGFVVQRIDDVTLPGYGGVVRLTAATKEPT